MNAKKILIFGKNGQLARSFEQTEPQSNPVRLLRLGSQQVDFLNQPDFDMILSQYKPDIAINCAAFTDVDGAEKETEKAQLLNAKMPANLAQSCAKLDIALIHFSTDFVFDGNAGKPYDETDKSAPQTSYGYTKWQGEEAILNTDAKALILRTSWLYSPFGSNFVTKMLDLGAKNKALRVVHDEFGSPTNALDLAIAVWQLIEDWKADQPAKLYHLAGEGHASRFEFAEHIFDCARSLDWPFPKTLSPISKSEFTSVAPRPTDSRLDCKRIEKDHAIRLPHWREGVLRTVQQIASRNGN